MFMEREALATLRARPEATSGVRDGSSEEEIAQPLARGLATDLADRVRQRDLLRARFDAVLRVAARGDAARTHQRLEALVGDVAAHRVQVREQGLADGGRADEVVPPPHLRTDLEAAPAGDALVQAVHEFLDVG